MFPQPGRRSLGKVTEQRSQSGGTLLPVVLHLSAQKVKPAAARAPHGAPIPKRTRLKQERAEPAFDRCAPGRLTARARS